MTGGLICHVRCGGRFPAGIFRKVLLPGRSCPGQNLLNGTRGFCSGCLCLLFLTAVHLLQLCAERRQTFQGFFAPFLPGKTVVVGCLLITLLGNLALLVEFPKIIARIRVENITVLNPAEPRIGGILLLREQIALCAAVSNNQICRFVIRLADRRGRPPVGLPNVAFFAVSVIIIVHEEGSRSDHALLGSLCHQALRRRNVLFGRRIAKINEGQLHLGGRISLTRGTEKPFRRFPVIAGHIPVAILVDQPQVVLHLRIPVPGSLLIPFQRDNLVGLGADAGQETVAEVVFRIGIILLCGHLKPVDGRLLVFFCSLPLQVAVAQHILSLRIAQTRSLVKAGSSFSIPVLCLTEILRNTESLL